MQHRVLRTEVVVGDTRDFGIGRRVNADKTGTPSGPLATMPTSVFATLKRPTPSPLPMWSPSPR